MANIAVKTERLELLKESVLKSIYDYCDSVFLGDDTSGHGTIDIKHNNEVIGSVYYDVMQEADRWGERSFILQECEVEMMLSRGSEPMPNVTALLNKELRGHEGEYLNY